MANRMATMQGCCCTPTAPILCNQKTPGVGAVSLQRSGFINDTPNPGGSETRPTSPSNWFVAAFMLVASTHAGEFYLIWRRSFTPTDVTSIFGTTYYFAHDQNEVFSAATLSIYRRPTPFDAFVKVLPGTAAATLINEALGTTNIHAATMIASPFNQLQQTPFPSWPESSNFVRLAGYDVPGSGVTWLDKPSELKRFWLNQTSTFALTAIAGNLSAGFTLLPSGVGPFDFLIYAIGGQTPTGSPLVPELANDYSRVTLCHPAEPNVNYGTLNLTLGGVTYSGLPSQAQFDAAGAGWKRAALIDIIDGLNGSYAVRHFTQGLQFYGVSPDWWVELSLGNSRPGLFEPSVIFTSANPADRKRLQIYVRFAPRQPLSGTPNSAGNVYGEITLQTSATYKAEEALPLLAGCELIEATIGVNAFKFVRSVDPAATAASLLSLCDQKLVNEPTLSIFVPPTNPRIELDAVTVGIA